MAKPPMPDPIGWTPPPPRGVVIYDPDERAAYEHGKRVGTFAGAVLTLLCLVMAGCLIGLGFSLKG
ncbi:MAG: hypothetical protein VR70_05880 [Rhodospirillaceae bacterium BRH_c57]|nr:MAG: hypothetical protein VR70_05880 [Rhodospirillaceae bacterium BRH_c57]